VRRCVVHVGQGHAVGEQVGGHVATEARRAGVDGLEVHRLPDGPRLDAVGGQRGDQPVPVEGRDAGSSVIDVSHHDGTVPRAVSSSSTSGMNVTPGRADSAAR
jgi:hypothetical protein